MGVRMSELKEEGELGSRQATLLTYLRSGATSSRSSTAPPAQLVNSTSGNSTADIQSTATELLDQRDIGSSLPGSDWNRDALLMRPEQSYSCPVCGGHFRQEVNFNFKCCSFKTYLVFISKKIFF
jgi:hypothetical protein